MTTATKHLTVLGAGVMGTSITTLALGHGVGVELVDIDAGKLDNARTAIAAQLRMAQLMDALPADVPRGELVTGTSPLGAADAVAVIEAITEDADRKAKVLAEVAAAVRPGTPLITNTSSIPIAELATAVPRPDELIGTHFMNPPYLITTVEVIRGPLTDDRTLAAVTALLHRIGRQAIVVRDAPGFVTSRVLHPMINDAIRIVHEGTASAEDVDALMCGCLGHPTGPLRTADLIGLDNLADSLWVLLERTGDEGCRPCPLLVDMVARGDLGRKTGRGFFHYEETLQ
ncbi:methoxymalonate biosynthesis protein [Nocardia tenerifensis]|uniref:Methoxymalonate biosynthesis protein n=1 Tax=Nocardia tenerifensis TaxID=228006 RepID=A0A318L039_9NOCA|nr:3-hydroxyacyl-CoA dehydrogenase family protein [Nocardia tenerifensis]PXX71484.1 methoxymalonate biosynthesis protein [Nocardia tenerifensis]